MGVAIHLSANRPKHAAAIAAGRGTKNNSTPGPLDDMSSHVHVVVYFSAPYLSFRLSLASDLFVVTGDGGVDGGPIIPPVISPRDPSMAHERARIDRRRQRRRSKLGCSGHQEAADRRHDDE